MLKMAAGTGQLFFLYDFDSRSSKGIMLVQMLGK
jgi:hypothetical protein